MINLQGKVAVVTGASRQIGIGAAIAQALAEAGADIFITYYRPYDASQPWGSVTAEAERLLADVRALDVRTTGLEIDLGEPEAAPQLFDAVEAALGRPHILVNNATNSERDGVEALTAALIDRHYRVNIRGMMLLCAEFVRRWQGAAGGRIINLSSGQSLGPMPGELAYVATKGAVEAFTLSLSAEVARRGITVNAINPGVTDTGWIPPDLKREWTAKAPLGRLGQPQDAARLIRFLASDEAAWITGQVIHSTGGIWG
jgi:3-oxoacyl-[acyl-carrier protein] reductase